MAKKTAAKKPEVKKPRRRLKRTARRSLAAVLMITAVVVAAIPVPENAAADADTPGTSDDELAVPYEYDTDKYTVNKFGGPSLKRPTKKVDGKEVEDTDRIFRTHYIFKDGDTYRMEWQYEFFKTGGDDSKGIICGYNDMYPVDLLKVSTNPIYSYYTVLDEKRKGSDGKTEEAGNSRDTYAEFKTKAMTPGTESAPNKYYKTFTCSAKPDIELNLGDAEFKRYFPAEFDAQVAKAEKYDTLKKEYDAKYDEFLGTNPTQAEIDAWKLANAIPEEAEPEQITKTPADFSLDNDEYVWRLYYCDAHSSLKGYILTKVADSDRTSKLGSPTTVYSYVPQRINIADKTESDDDDGFRIDDHTDFIGIGDEAFGTSDPKGTGVQNVANIELPDAIKYIGDYAFAGSFIGSIRMVNVENVGNYAFRTCPKLSKVEFVQGVTRIGKEAFYGVQNLKEITFPGTITYIGPAAFAECIQLSDADFSALSESLTVDDYAFYNDVMLNKVNFVRAGTEDTTVTIVGLGKGAFAVKGSVKGDLTDFVIPLGISSNEGVAGTNGGMDVGGQGLGDYLLAGRTNLKHVTMSENYGSSKSITLPDDLFFNCISLEWVKFPATGSSCGFVKYKEDLFDTVSNPDFYVEGPKYLSPSNKVPAYPRESTWAAKSAVSDTIPYVYIENGVRYVEVSDGIYLQCIDADGMLISCTLKPKAVVPSDGIDLIIPAEVAGVTVTGIKSGCFSDPNLNSEVRTLTILDGSKLTTIDDSVFAGWEKLQKVYIGDSVRNLGNNLFAGDRNLTDITFNTPESAVAEFTVGTDAFKTNGVELTFHGMINGQYQPYIWAMDAKEGEIDADSGTRVCYKSLAPTSLTVMYDASTKKVTLLDYPKYEDVETILGESYATKKGVNWKNWVKLDGTKAKSTADFYKDWMERDYYAKYSGEQYDTKREAFRTAWSGAASAEAVYGNYEVYGPWITPEFCKYYTSTGGGAGTGGGSTGDETAKGVFDWLFEPITAHAMSGAPDPYFETHHYSVFENYEGSIGNVYGPYQTQTKDELDVINATKHITVPDGVTSIDVKGYLDADVNSGNKATYFTVEKLGQKTAEMYRLSKGSEDKYQDREKDVVGGLFSGDYKDYQTDKEDEVSPNESLTKGNDRLESIDLNGVTSLPQYAFDNCENLQKVTIGEACTDIGTLPFRGCTSLTNVIISENNPKYLVERENDICKKIIYSRNGVAENGDTLYKIEECLETRGKGNDNSVLDSGYDTLISKVNALAEGALSSCVDVEDVNLTDATNLTVVPKRSFRDCSNLNTIQLPPSVNKIEEYAFYNADKLSTLRIPGREVSFTDDVFEDANKSRTDVVTYEDSAARRYADTNSQKYNLRWVNIGDLWEVKFYDMDGIQLGSTISVEDNTRLKKEQIPENPVKEGYVFETWVGTGGITVEDYITQPTNFIAKYNYNSDGAPIDGKYVVEFHDGVDGQQLAGRGSKPEDGKYYVEAGKSFADMGWPEPVHPNHAGYEAYGFSSGNNSEGQWTADTKVTSNLSIIALYKASPTATTSGGSTTTSGGTTTTTSTGSTSSSSKTSSSSSSSSSTSSSSTSSASTTSGPGMYTVFVEGGSGSGSYMPGTTVIVSAYTPAAGMRFEKWTTDSNGVTIPSVSIPVATFTMPSNNVTIKANYVETDVTAPQTATVSTGGTGTTDDDDGNTRVDIQKPGISNRDLATANVNGSTDNFVVKISETDEATKAVAAALTNKYGTLDNILYYAMDISLYDSTGTTKISDTTGLSVDITIPIPDSLVAYGGNNMAGAVINGNQLESLNENFTTINGVPCVRFRATHFSPYTIYVDTGNLVEGTLDTTPQTGDPIHPKWFLSLGLACLSIILFMKRDKKTAVKVKAKS